MPSFAKAFFATALAAALTGCESYQTGSSVPLELRTISVPTFENASGYPQIEAITTQAVLSEFRREGTMQIVDRENAALEVVGRITSCKLEPMNYDHNRPYLSVEYRLVVTADVKVYECATGKVMTRLVKVTGDDIFRTQSDLPSTQRDALPRAAARLARAIVNGTVNCWWPEPPDPVPQKTATP
ncbi:MAG: LptE family protein [bacterium]